MYPTLSLRMQTRIGPQLVLSVQLLRLSSAALEEQVRQEIVENPALELVEGWYRSGEDRSPLLEDGAHWTGRGSRRAGGLASARFDSEHGAEDMLENLPARRTVVEQLTEQVALLVDASEIDTAVGLLHCLDARGYLKETPEELARLLGADRSTVERLIRTLHELEPPGIGAHDLRECFLIQCAHLEVEGLDCRIASRILNEAWDDFLHWRWERVSRRLRLSHEALEEARCFICRNLYPYPLGMIQDSDVSDGLTYADFVVRRAQRGSWMKFRLEIPGEEAFELRISESFESALKAGDGEGGGLASPERVWAQAQAERARLFMASLAQRWTTLRRIGEFLIEYQADFLEQGPRALRPLTRAEVAGALGLHESTVSRAVSEKTIQLPGGCILPLSDLFDGSLPVKEAIRQLLSRKQEPLSDREITERLQAEGFDVARRTVAKYRDQLRIPANYLR